MAAIRLDILTPLGALCERAEVEGVEVPGIEGELGLLPQHEALVTAIRPGVIRFKEGATSRRVAVGPGFLEIKKAGRVVVLVDQAIDSGDIDRETVLEHAREARQRLDTFKGATQTSAHRSLHMRWAWLDAQLRAAQNS